MRTKLWAGFAIAALAVSAFTSLPAQARGPEARETTGSYAFQWMIGPNDDGTTEVCKVRPDCNVIIEKRKGERFISVTVTENDGSPTPFELLDATGESVLGLYCGEVANFKMVEPTVRLHFVNPDSCGRSTVGSFTILFSKSALRQGATN